VTKLNTKTHVKSLRALAELVGFAHSTLSDWMRHADWPFATVAPWPVSQVGAMIDWHDENVEQGGSRSAQIPREPMAVPGKFKFTGTEMPDKLVRFFHLDQTIIGKFTVDDLAELAEGWTIVVAYLMVARAEANGETWNVEGGMVNACGYRLLSEVPHDDLQER